VIKLDLLDGIIQAESGELSDEDMVLFVSEHQDTLMQLQGSWQRTVMSMKEEGLI
jgi:hypothetical protein